MIFFIDSAFIFLRLIRPFPNRVEKFQTRIARIKLAQIREFGVRGHVRAFKAATCRRSPQRHRRDIFGLCRRPPCRTYGAFEFVVMHFYKDASPTGFEKLNPCSSVVIRGQKCSRQFVRFVSKVFDFNTSPSAQWKKFVRRTSSGLRPPSPQSGEGISPVAAEREFIFLHFARKTFNPWAWIQN
jgi:hypothetical protein